MDAGRCLWVMASYPSLSRLPKGGKNDDGDYGKGKDCGQRQEDSAEIHGKQRRQREGARVQGEGAASDLQQDLNKGIIANEEVQIPVVVASPSRSNNSRPSESESSPSFIERWTTSIFDSSILPSCPGFLSQADDADGKAHKKAKDPKKSVAKVSVDDDNCLESTGKQAVSLLDKESGGSSRSGSTSPEGNITLARENNSAAQSHAKSSRDHIIYVQNELQSIPSPRRKNRSSTPKQIRTEKIHRLIEEIQFMPIPSIVRSQVLAVHEFDAQRKAERKKKLHFSLHSSSSEEEEDEPLNPDSSCYEPLSAHERQSVFRKNSSSRGDETSGHHSLTSHDMALPLSSTISSPYYSPPASLTGSAYDNPATKIHSASYLHSLSTPRASSPPLVNVTPSPIIKQRRAQSFDAFFDTTARLTENKSPSTSIFDWQGSSASKGKDKRSRRGQAGYVSEDEDQSNWIESVCSPCGYYASTQGEDSDNEIESMSATRSRRSLQSARGKAKGNVGCGGYIDYSGVFHECNNVGRQSGGRHCQGCIFRRGARDGDGRSFDDDIPDVDDDLYYDSDPGQFFAIDSWTSPTYRPSRDHSSDASDETESGPLMDIYRDNSDEVIEKAKSKWRLRSKTLRRRSIRRSRKKKDFPSKVEGVVSKDDDSATSYRDTQTTQQQIARRVHGKPEDQQAYLYDYFSRREIEFGNALKTGGFSTDEKDVGDCVQESLNSKWRLLWHVVKIKNKPNKGLLSILPNPPPKLCDVWIERGFRRNRNEIVEPKLMWSEVTRPHLQKSRILGESTARPYRVSLLAVRRIVCVSIEENRVGGIVTDNASNIQQPINSSPSGPRRPLMPTSAKPHCLILIRSSLGDDYLFEASCKEERDRIVHLWKMTTARLVSHAVVGDGERMIEEFFNESRVSGGLHASLVTDGE